MNRGTALMGAVSLAAATLVAGSRAAGGDLPPPIPVADPDTVAVQEGPRYVTYGGSRPDAACSGGECWIPYVTRGKG